MVMNGNHTWGIEATMSDHQRNIMITKIINERHKIWQDETEEE